MDSTDISYRIVQYLSLLDFYLLYLIVKVLLSNSTARIVKLLLSAKPLKFQQSTILYYPYSTKVNIYLCLIEVNGIFRCQNKQSRYLKSAENTFRIINVLDE